MAITACNMPTGSNIPEATETLQYLAPLPTDSFPTLMARMNPSPTPFQPATSTPTPTGKLIVVGRWTNDYVITIDTIFERNTSAPVNIEFSLVCDGATIASGKINEGLNSVNCQPNEFQFKIGNNVVIEGKKDGYIVTPMQQFIIP